MNERWIVGDTWGHNYERKNGRSFPLVEWICLEEASIRRVD